MTFNSSDSNSRPNQQILLTPYQTQANQTMNLNNPHAFCVQVFSSETNVLGHLSYRTKAEKQAILKRCKKEGKEENLNAICSYCRFDSRKVVKKDSADPHYGCTNKCCPMLHYWDMCSHCIQDFHHPVIQDEEQRHAEVVTFQRVFSNLPEDIQHYIGEFVPQMFEFIRSMNRVIGYRLFGTVDHLNFPKSAWKKAYQQMQQSLGGVRSKTRRDYFEEVKYLYKYTYAGQHQQITEQDFWTHFPVSRMFHNNKYINALEEIKTILHN